MQVFRKALFVGLTGCVLAVGGASASPLTIFSSNGGAPTGAVRFNFDGLTPGSGSPLITTSVDGSTQMRLVFNPQAGVVTGAMSNVYAPPVISGSNGIGFGAGGGIQANGATTTPYLTTGSTGAQGFGNASMTFELPFAAQYFGLLWGSVDTYNTLSFFDGNTLVGSITGSQVTPNATGNQGASGTFYVNINSTTAFNRVVATSSQFAFEIENVALQRGPGNDPNVTVPTPAALALFGLGLLALGALRRRA
jgi:MYXO-CTERM domain-containing protein